MFASLVLPFQITVVVFLVVLVVSNLWVRNGKFALLSILGSVLLFVPSCIGVMAVVDTFRYGTFEYATASEINHDPYIELPPNAKQVVLHRDGGGHAARFEVETEELLEWIAERRELRPDLNGAFHTDEIWERADHMRRDEMLEPRRRGFESDFRGTDWRLDPEMSWFHVSRSDRGGGYAIWHAPGSGVAYLRAGYW